MDLWLIGKEFRLICDLPNSGLHEVTQDYMRLHWVT